MNSLAMLNFAEFSTTVSSIPFNHLWDPAKSSVHLRVLLNLFFILLFSLFSRLFFETGPFFQSLFLRLLIFKNAPWQVFKKGGLAPLHRSARRLAAKIGEVGCTPALTYTIVHHDAGVDSSLSSAMILVPK
jgi:hypothetical protein